eukprot:5009160-Prymnesium_polylepis.2
MDDIDYDEWQLAAIQIGERSVAPQVVALLDDSEEDEEAKTVVGVGEDDWPMTVVRGRSFHGNDVAFFSDVRTVDDAKRALRMFAETVQPGCHGDLCALFSGNRLSIKKGAICYHPEGECSKFVTKYPDATLVYFRDRGRAQSELPLHPTSKSAPTV